MAEQAALGNLKKTYGNARVRRTATGIVIGIVLVVVSLIFQDKGIRFTLMGLGILLAFINVLMIPGTLISMARNVTVSVFDNGFIHSVRGKTKTILWSDIQNVEYHLTKVEGAGAIGALAHEIRYTVVLSNGERLVLSSANLKKVNELGKLIEKQVATRQQPQPA